MSRPARWCWPAFHLAAAAWTGAFLIVVLATIPHVHEINAFIGQAVGLEIDYLLLVLVAWLAVLVHFSVLAGVYIVAARQRRVVRWHVPIARISVALLAAWTAFCVVLLVLAGSVLAFLSRFVAGTWPILLLAIEIPLVLATTAAAPRLFQHARRALATPRHPAARRSVACLAIVACTLGGAFSLPLVAPPVVVSDRPLPTKPLVIAHRGASHFAPENTMAAGEAAVAFGCVGWEIDVQVSVDGEFFLLHDDTFERTTNVRDVFPGKSHLDAAWFTMAEIQQLDAGSWFANGDPFWTIATGVVPRAVAGGYRGEPVPTLAAAIAFSLSHGLILDVDFKRPPADHPHAASARAALIGTIAASGLGKQAWIATSSAGAANNTRMTRPIDVDAFLASEYDLVNAGLEIPDRLLLDYLERDIPVVVYTVDDIFTFSTVWVHGATYVKSSRPWIFNGLPVPVMHASTATHLMLWIIIYSTGALAACIVLVRGRGPRHHPASPVIPRA